MTIADQTESCLDAQYDYQTIVRLPPPPKSNMANKHERTKERELKIDEVIIKSMVYQHMKQEHSHSVVCLFVSVNMCMHARTYMGFAYCERTYD